MAWLKKITPEIVLRISLAIMYFYSGFDIVKNPTGWLWAIRSLPEFVKDIFISPIGDTNFLVIQGCIELIFALIFILWFMPKVVVKIAAFLSSLQMAMILLMVGLSLETFRDFGVIGASISLFLLLNNPKQ
jgi:hypothetical protein